jgi:hypothetical protein
MQQIRGGLSVEFDIQDSQGQVVGMVGGTESGIRRFFAGCREFDVLDVDGMRLAHVSDIRDFWRDTYQITRGDGSVLASIARKSAFFSVKFSIVLASGEQLMVRGSFMSREFDVVNSASEEIVAQVSRERAGFAEAILGHDRYALYFPEGTSTDLRLAIIGGMIALDLMRAKDTASSTNNSNKS